MKRLLIILAMLVSGTAIAELGVPNDRTYGYDLGIGFRDGGIFEIHNGIQYFPSLSEVYELHYMRLDSRMTEYSHGPTVVTQMLGESISFLYRKNFWWTFNVAAGIDMTTVKAEYDIAFTDIGEKLGSYKRFNGDIRIGWQLFEPGTKVGADFVGALIPIQQRNNFKEKTIVPWQMRGNRTFKSTSDGTQWTFLRGYVGWYF